MPLPAVKTMMLFLFLTLFAQLPTPVCSSNSSNNATSIIPETYVNMTALTELETTVTVAIIVCTNPNDGTNYTVPGLNESFVSNGTDINGEYEYGVVFSHSNGTMCRAVETVGSNGYGPNNDDCVEVNGPGWTCYQGKFNQDLLFFQGEIVDDCELRKVYYYDASFRYGEQQPNYTDFDVQCSNVPFDPLADKPALADVLLRQNQELYPYVAGLACFDMTEQWPSYFAWHSETRLGNDFYQAYKGPNAVCEPTIYQPGPHPSLCTSRYTMADFCTPNGTLNVDHVLNGLLPDDCFIREVIGDIKSGQEESDGYWNSECEGLASESDVATDISTDLDQNATSLATTHTSSDGADPPLSQSAPSQGQGSTTTTAAADSSSPINQASAATTATTIALLPWATVSIILHCAFL